MDASFFLVFFFYPCTFYQSVAKKSGSAKPGTSKKGDGSGHSKPSALVEHEDVEVKH